MPIINNPGGGLPAGVLKFKGSQDCSGNPNYPAASAGDAYIVSVAGKIGGASGTTVEAGDLYTASADNAGGTQASVGASWVVTQANVVLGTGVATALAIAVGSAGAIVVNGGALGTPSSGTLTNATGLPASGVTGTAVTQTTLSNATLPASFTTLAASGAVTFTGGSLTGGAGNFTFTAGTGNSRTLIFQTTTSGGVATTALTLGADQSATFAGSVAVGSGAQSGLVSIKGAAGSWGQLVVDSTDAGTASLVSMFQGGTRKWAFFVPGGSNDFQFYSQTVPGAVLTLTGAGGATLLGRLILDSATLNGPIRLKGYTVATLPAGTVGDTAYVTDALAPTFLATVVGGGAVVTPVFFNGSAWVGS